MNAHYNGLQIDGVRAVQLHECAWMFVPHILSCNWPSHTPRLKPALS